MQKSIFDRQYAVLLELLRSTRRAAGITQTELAALLDRSQSFVSKTERGETRLDVIQLRTICHALGKSLPEFVSEMEEKLGGLAGQRRSQQKRVRRTKSG